MENKYTHITKREGPTSHEMAVELSLYFQIRMYVDARCGHYVNGPLFHSSYYQYPRIPVCMRISASK